MRIETGKITAKGQTIIPSSLCKQLGLSNGDDILFEQNGDTILIRKATKLDKAYYKSLYASFSCEWDSSEDCKAYDEL